MRGSLVFLSGVLPMISGAKMRFTPLDSAQAVRNAGEWWLFAVTMNADENKSAKVDRNSCNINNVY